MKITTNPMGINIPYETAIALYRSGYLDPAVLGYFMPIAIATQCCPEILYPSDEIAKIALVFRENEFKGGMK